MSDQFNTHPQPRTFAPSKEDVLQNLMYFFGSPVSPEKLKDYSEHHAMTYHFPGAPLAPLSITTCTTQPMRLFSPLFDVSLLNVGTQMPTRARTPRSGTR